VRDNALRLLNRRFRGKNSGTDVLSFPGFPDNAPVSSRPGKTPGRITSPAADRYLGDVVISVDTATRQARDSRHSVDREIDELVIHGVLHLCGYDHETDGGEMNKIELSLRGRLLRKKGRSA
ncbi:MAG TPA: rRNA maturation RNase YbeY, partial [Blastocatellia bacterium]|nr:rRNA maturation RNase YbeY [Blastocatellia bacterium]